MKIGVFDSGVGGLTVLGALMKQIPAADYIYLGDTARLPYGSKSQATIARYAVSSVRFLVEEGADFLVIACNTASALALDAIKDAVRVPVLGVIETGANAAQASSMTGDVLVIATHATVTSHAYKTACAERDLRAFEKACPLLVPLVEEGWIDHPVTYAVLQIYLAELLRQSADVELNPDTLVLGCTHYPLLRQQIERTIPELRVIDSAEVTAVQVAESLDHRLRTDGNGVRKFYATDSVEKFKRLGTRFLGEEIECVGLVDLGG
jgi:glutamate racemase